MDLLHGDRERNRGRNRYRNRPIPTKHDSDPDCDPDSDSDTVLFFRQSRFVSRSVYSHAISECRRNCGASSRHTAVGCSLPG